MCLKKEYSDFELEKIFETPYVSSTILSEELNIPASTIRGIRNRNGVKIRKFFAPPLDEFIQKCEESHSSSKVASYYGVNRHTVSNFAKEIGITIREPSKLNESQIEDIISKYYTHTAKELATQYGVSDNKIQQIWTNNGLKNKETRKYSLDQNVFKTINPQNAYLLGFIAADGCLSHNEDKQDTISITIHKKDIEILELFRREFKTNKPIFEREDYVSLQLSSDEIVEDIKKLGITYRKTYGNTIADIPDDMFIHFIRGYYDGDGSISISDKDELRITIAGYHNNLDKIKNFLEAKHIFSSIVQDKRKYLKSSEGPFGSLVFSNKTAKYCFIKELYRDCGDFYLKRKKDLSDLFIKTLEESKEVRDKQIVIYYNYAVQKISG